MSKVITLQEVRQRKLEIENQIKDLLNGFIVDANMQVDGVAVRLSHGFALTGPDQGLLDGVIHVELEIRL